MKKLIAILSITSILGVSALLTGWKMSNLNYSQSNLIADGGNDWDGG
ncbi:MAG: hypothetical protein KC422_26195 [Trueperaceae bacterium]|nr:hypothetical protein [Trueperaceae bacterium]